MTLRNLFALIGIVGVSLACYNEARLQSGTYERMFQTFAQVMDEVDRHYLEEVDQQELFEGALKGMVSTLDQYSAYVGPQEYVEFRESLSQKFGGIGIYVLMDEESGLLTVASPLVGTPAFRAGVLAGDKIVAIDGQSTEGFTMDDALHRLRGEPGTSVRLSVLHDGAGQTEDILIERDTIKVDTVLGDVQRADGAWDFLLSEEDRIGYVRVTSFAEQTVDELTAAIAQLEQQNAKGLIIDLRNNAGGLLSAATQTCDMFLESGVIVTTRGRDDTVRDRYEAYSGSVARGWPIAVLVNNYSASASEIVAACLKDHGRAVVVGERTWGKGTVQEVIMLRDGKSVLKLTTASYWRPSNQNIHRRADAEEDDQWGVRPNEGYEVKLDRDEFVRMMTERRRRDTQVAGAVQDEIDPSAEEEAAEPFVDRQLERALEYIRESLGQPSVSPQAA